MKKQVDNRNISLGHVPTLLFDDRLPLEEKGLKFPLDVTVDEASTHHQGQQAMKNTILSAIEIPDPTPIGPSGVKIVSTLPMSCALWTSNRSQIEAFYKLFSPFLLPKYQHQLSYMADPLPERATSAPPPCAKRERVGTTRAQYGKQQTAKWNLRFEELVQFRKHHGHCVVPMHNHPNTALSNWVKRQRNQYHRKASGLHSTLSDERQKALEELDFIWDAQTAMWDERYKELSQFYRENGHSKVPKSYKKNPGLATWVKCQRRHHKLLKTNRLSSMTKQRIRRLKKLQFDFTPRS